MNSTERNRPTWDNYCMSLAFAASLRAQDPMYRVGAAAFRENRSTISTGYNGSPSGVELDWGDRNICRPYIKHAEINCLEYASPGDVHYLYVTHTPCENCMRKIVAFGVKEIYYAIPYQKGIHASELAQEHNIKLIHIPFNEYEYYTSYIK